MYNFRRICHESWYYWCRNHGFPGIAQAFAQVDGYEVCLCDINEEFASNGKLKISKNFEKRVAKGKMAKEDADKILARIHTGVKTICSDCDLVVEAAIENMEIKKQTFKELAAICKADCVFATNTSSLSITEIGAGLDRRLSVCTSSTRLRL